MDWTKDQGYWQLGKYNSVMEFGVVIPICLSDSQSHLWSLCFMGIMSLTNELWWYMLFLCDAWVFFHTVSLGKQDNTGRKWLWFYCMWWWRLVLDSSWGSINCSPCFTQYLCWCVGASGSKIIPNSRRGVHFHLEVFVHHTTLAILSFLIHCNCHQFDTINLRVGSWGFIWLAKWCEGSVWQVKWLLAKFECMACVKIFLLRLVFRAGSYAEGEYTLLSVSPAVYV